MTSSDSSEEIESFPTEEEEATSSVSEEIIDEELPLLEEKQEFPLLEEAEAREENLSAKETTVGDIPRNASSSSLDFSSHPSVRQSMLLTRKEEMLQQARR